MKKTKPKRQDLMEILFRDVFSNLTNCEYYHASKRCERKGFHIYSLAKWLWTMTDRSESHGGIILNTYFGIFDGVLRVTMNFVGLRNETIYTSGRYMMGWILNRWMERLPERWPAVISSYIMWDGRLFNYLRTVLFWRSDAHVDTEKTEFISRFRCKNACWKPSPSHLNVLCELNFICKHNMQSLYKTHN